MMYIILNPKTLAFYPRIFTTLKQAQKVYSEALATYGITTDSMIFRLSGNAETGS